MTNEIPTQKIISLSVANILNTLTKTMRESHCTSAQIAKFQRDFLESNGVEVPEDFEAATRCTRKLDEACNAAIEVLSTGAMNMCDFEEEMRERGYKTKTIRNAKVRLKEEGILRYYLSGENKTKRWRIELLDKDEGSKDEAYG